MTEPAGSAQKPYDEMFITRIGCASNRSMPLDQKWEQLTRALDRSSNEDTIVWTVFSIFWAANIGLLIALFSDGDFPKHNSIGAVIGLVGFVLSLIWHIIQWRALGHLNRFDLLVFRLESELIPESETQYALSTKINKGDYKETLGDTISVRWLMPKCPLAVSVVWLLCTGCFLFRIFVNYCDAQ